MGHAKSSLLIRRVGRLLPMTPGVAEIRDAAVVIRDGAIQFAGPESDLNREEVRDLPILDAEGGLVTPGLVDCHTHLVFAGSRADEFEARGTGLSYEEITRRGGGILRTVAATRSASHEELIAAALPRVWRSLALGVTTIEVKSGYGLTLESELQILRVIRDLNAMTPADLVPTFLGAHAFPPEARGRRADHVAAIVHEWIPRVASEGLARFCDVFCESVAFSPSEAEAVLRAGLDANLLPKVHADQLSHSGGARLAAEVGAVSADHLDFADRRDIEALAARGVVGVLLPGCAISLGQTRFPDGTPFFEAGVKVAIASDYNPGSSVTQNLYLLGTLAMAYMGMTTMQTWAAITRHAAEAVGLGHRVGRLEPGYAGDLVVFHVDDPRIPFYDYGTSHVAKVVKGGVVVVQRSVAGEVSFRNCDGNPSELA